MYGLKDFLIIRNEFLMLISAHINIQKKYEYILIRICEFTWERARGFKKRKQWNMYGIIIDIQIYFINEKCARVFFPLKALKINLI